MAEVAGSNRWPLCRKDWIALVRRLEIELAEAKRVLVWYADESHYYNTGSETCMEDKGQRARDFLKKEDGNE